MQQQPLIFPTIIVMLCLEDSQVCIQFVLQERLVDSAIEILGEINAVIDVDLWEFRRERIEQGISLV